MRPGRRWLAATVVMAMLPAGDIAGQSAELLVQAQPRPKPHGRLFPPQDLGLLEAPDRDIWQHPDQIMDTLGIAEGAVVADIGAGSGWFTIRLARRVGPNGIVYAEDVQPEAITAISRRVNAEGLLNVRPRLGKGSRSAAASLRPRCGAAGGRLSRDRGSRSRCSAIWRRRCARAAGSAW